MHEGHRQRMYEKLENGDDLFDHEVLEILLYSACPRVNTNPIAHALLDRFVSLPKVFEAGVDELKSVDGVGESTARFIKTVGKCVERLGSLKNTPSLKTNGACRQFVDLRLSGKTEEIIEMYFVNQAYRVERIVSYTTGEQSRAAANISSIAKSIATFSPYGIIVAHNHLGGSSSPSGYDDGFTRLVQFVCDMNEVQLLDHIIYLSKDDIYSYKDCGQLNKIKSLCNLENFEKWIKTLS